MVTHGQRLVAVEVLVVTLVFTGGNRSWTGSRKAALVPVSLETGEAPVDVVILLAVNTLHNYCIIVFKFHFITWMLRLVLTVVCSLFHCRETILWQNWNDALSTCFLCLQQLRLGQHNSNPCHLSTAASSENLFLCVVFSPVHYWL